MLDEIAAAIQKPERLGEDEHAAEHIAGSARMSPAQQLDVYREQFWLRHVKSLRDDFATLHYLLGDSAFEKLCQEYAAAHPPDHFRLRDFSAKMADFVASREPLIADCARLEWALIEAFDEADAPPLDPASVVAIGEDDWPRAKIALHPSLRLLDVAYPIKNFREEIRKGEKPARPAPAPAFYGTYRRTENVFVEPIDRAAFMLLRALRSGDALGVACERAAAEEDVDAKIGEWFQRWVSLGWVTSVHV